MTNLQRRLKKLEARSDPRGPVRLVVRYETGDPQDTDETESDVDENDPNTLVVVVQYVDMPAKATCGAGAGAAGLASRIATDMLSYRQLPSPSHRLAAYRPNSERLTDSDMVTKTYVKWPTSRAR